MKIENNKYRIGRYDPKTETYIAESDPMTYDTAKAWIAIAEQEEMENYKKINTAPGSVFEALRKKLKLDDE
jgi:hypothetical protein